MDETPEKYEAWAANSPAGHKKELIRRFLEQTLEYAHTHIAERQKELKELEKRTDPDDPELQFRRKRLQLWEGYVEFQRHTLEELEGTKIDRFID